MGLTLYHGRVSHTRHAPKTHAFVYPVFFCAIDVDALSSLDALWPFGGYNRAAFLSIHDKDHLGNAPGSIRDKLLGWFAGGAESGRTCRAEVLTIPRIMGYVYNPVNFYLGYDREDELTCALAEINNTYGETHLYLLDRPTPYGHGVRAFRANKEFFVSPFFDLRGEYLFEFRRSHGEIDVRVTLFRLGERALSARLWGKAAPLSRKTISVTLLRYPFSAALTLPRIAWQARKLTGKGLPTLLKPVPTSPMTIRRVGRKSPMHRS
jgi:cyclopropane-fatty-acyl-phospholipid synthase